MAALLLYSVLALSFAVLTWRHYALHRERPSAGLLLFTALLSTEALEMAALALTLLYRAWMLHATGERPNVESFLILARIPTLARVVIAYAFLWALRYSTTGPERVTTVREIVRYLGGGIGAWVDALLPTIPLVGARRAKRRKARAPAREDPAPPLPTDLP